MKDIKEIEKIVEQLVWDISRSDMPGPLTDVLENLCSKYEFAQKIVYSYFEAEQNLEVKQLLALVLIRFMINDITLRQFLTGRGWTQEDFDDAVQYS